MRYLSPAAERFIPTDDLGMNSFIDLFLHLDTPVNNDRYVSLHFELKHATVLHGFAGYFDTVLYDEHTLSELLPVIATNYAHHSSFATCGAAPV